MSVAPANIGRTGEDLSALVSSRICHDLINPMGAIANGLELLETVSKNLGPELELVAHSVESATARLNYYRVAFGQAQADAELRNASLVKIICDMHTFSRFDPQVVTRQVATSRQRARTMLLVLLCAESAMPLGGRLGVTETVEGWKIEGEGPRVQINQPLWDALTIGGPVPEPAAGNVHFAATAAALRDYGLCVELSVHEGGLAVVLREEALAVA